MVDFGRVNGIALVVTLAVGNIGDEAFGFSELPADEFYDVDVFHFIMSADIVYFALAPVVNDQIDGTAVILHIQPVPDIQSLAVNRQRLIVQCVFNHQRDQLFRKLVRTVVVGAAGDGYRQTVGAVISHDQEICGGLGGTVRAAGMDRRIFREEKVRAVNRKITVHFIG